MNEETLAANRKGRNDLANWQQAIQQNIFLIDKDFQHSCAIYFTHDNNILKNELENFARRISEELDLLVRENNLDQNLPRLEAYNGIGERVEVIVHHPTYTQSGDIIYSSRLLERMAKPGGLLEALTFMFLSSQTGEAGHNCPLACSAGIIRVLQKFGDFPQKGELLQKLIVPSYQDNFTGAQFLTEVQGGSDVGLNATKAYQDENQQWRIKGEKWFCSNANADLILMTARFDNNLSGTKGLGLFLVPAKLENGEHNYYTIRRLKNKIGTRSMASGEIDFHAAYAFAIGDPTEGFKIVMENVLHISRLFNTFCMLGMARRAYYIAKAYAEHRVAFGQSIIHYPLVIENLARIKAENTAMLAAAFATTKLQDKFDLEKVEVINIKLILRLLANLNKYISALWSVEHIHHCIDVLAGNGAIESFSILPRLLRDSIVCENWEGTHNTLRMQILRDIERYQIDSLFFNYVHEQLKLIQGFKEKAILIQKYLTKLENDLQILRQANPELKTLIIKKIVDKMSIALCAIHLLQEAEQQKSVMHCDSKMFCFDYFCYIHFNETEIIYDQNYLSLIQAVINY